MNISVTGHVHPSTALSHSLHMQAITGPFALLLLDDLGLIVADPDDLERIAAECVSAASDLRAAAGEAAA